MIAAGISMAQHAEGRRDRFVAAGFGEDFVDQLKQAAVDLQRAVDVTSAQLGHRAAATSGMLQELARGRDLVRLLDAMVGSWLEDHMQDAYSGPSGHAFRFNAATHAASIRPASPEPCGQSPRVMESV